MSWGVRLGVIGSAKGNPINVPNLALALRSGIGYSGGHGAPCSQWNDQGPLAAHAVQGTGAAQPTIDLLTGPRAFLAFDGVADFMEGVWGSVVDTPGTLFVAARRNADANYMYFEASDNDTINRSVHLARDGTAGKTYARHGSLTGTGDALSAVDNGDLTDHVWRLTVEVSPSRRRLYKDGVLLDTNTTAGATATTATKYRLGKVFQLEIYQLNGRIYDALYYQRILSAGEAAAIEDVLSF